MSHTDTVDTPSPAQSEETIVSLSELAASKVREFLAAEELPDAGLRVSVLPGGCSGFEYGLEVDDEQREDDIVFTSQGIKLIVDPFSAQYLSGVRIDYHTSFQGSGFTFENPNSTGSCGCGSSFAV